MHCVLVSDVCWVLHVPFHNVKHHARCLYARTLFYADAFWCNGEKSSRCSRKLYSDSSLLPVPRQEIKNFCGSLSRRNLFFCVFTEASFSSRLFFFSNDDLDDSIDLLFKACHKYNKSNGLICGCHHLVKSFCIKNEPIWSFKSS